MEGYGGGTASGRPIKAAQVGGPLGAWVQGEAQVLRVTRNLAFLQGMVSADDVPAMRISGIFKIGKPFDPKQMAHVFPAPGG